MVNIRKAQLQDIEAIFRLGSAVPEFSVSGKTVSFWPKEILTEGVISKDVVVLVAEADGQIVGFIIANLNISLRKTIIENVYVTPERRGSGIGYKLLSKLLDTLGETPIGYVSTLVPMDAQRAARLYEEAGFVRGEAFLWLDKPTTNTFKSG